MRTSRVRQQVTFLLMVCRQTHDYSALWFGKNRQHAEHTYEAAIGELRARDRVTLLPRELTLKFANGSTLVFSHLPSERLLGMEFNSAGFLGGGTRDYDSDSVTNPPTEHE